MTRTLFAAALLVVALGVLPAAARGQPAGGEPTYHTLTTAHGEWPAYGGDAGHTRYSPLDQVDASNFGTWSWPGASIPPTSARRRSSSWREPR